MQNSKIEWTTHTFNPWIGCSKESPGCFHCYAERDFDLRKHVAKWGPGQPRHRTSEAYWRQPLRWNAEAEKSGIRPRVFCASLADWLDAEVPIEWLADLLELIHKTPHLDWLLLTKRPQNWDSRIHACFDILSLQPRWLVAWSMRTPPANVWIGTSIEDQQRADERIPALLEIPARIRFLSCEPLLGAVELRHHLLTPIIGCKHKDPNDGCCLNPKAMTPECHVDACLLPEAKQMIHWVICGGESGPQARPMHPAWARSLRDQCAQAGVPFLFKQWGEWLPDDERAFRTQGDITWGLVNKKGSFRLILDKGKRDLNQDPIWKSDEAGTTRIGKHAAGRLLAGIEHNAFPKL